jgi:hypothetical protein
MRRAEALRHGLHVMHVTAPDAPDRTWSHPHLRTRPHLTHLHLTHPIAPVAPDRTEASRENPFREL